MDGAHLCLCDQMRAPVTIADEGKYIEQRQLAGETNRSDPDGRRGRYLGTSVAPLPDNHQPYVWLGAKQSEVEVVFEASNPPLWMKNLTLTPDYFRGAFLY
jgi:hypothetical protein